MIIGLNWSTGLINKVKINSKENNYWGIQIVVVGHNNGVVGLTRFQNKEMTGLSFGSQKVQCTNNSPT